MLARESAPSIKSDEGKEDTIKYRAPIFAVKKKKKTQEVVLTFRVLQDGYRS